MDVLNEMSKFVDNLQKIAEEEKKSYLQKKMEATETSEEYQEDQFLSKNK